MNGIENKINKPIVKDKHNDYEGVKPSLDSGYLAISRGYFDFSNSYWIIHIINILTDLTGQKYSVMRNRVSILHIFFIPYRQIKKYFKVIVE